VSPSLPCYNFELGFTELLGFRFVDRKTTKVTKDKDSICCLARRSGVKIDTSIKTGRYWTKAHACPAILQEARTASLLAARRLEKSSNSKKQNKCNNQLIEQTRRGKELPSLHGEGVYCNGGGYSGGQGMQRDGNKADKSIDVVCAPSIQKDASSSSDHGNDGAKQMLRGKELQKSLQ
jgi:hypothetical protein